MKEINDKPKSLIFISSSKPDDAEYANSHFEIEARKMDVFWTSSALILPVDDYVKILEPSDLVIVLQRSDEPNILKTHASSWNGKSEVWIVPGDEDGKSIAEKSIGSLMIKLILQGGKRTPIISNTSSKPAQQESSGSGGKNVRVMRESKGRKGKTVTVISGLGMDDGQLLDLAASLKQLCGTGGTVKEGKIEIQGDQCDRVLAALIDKGYKAKRAGG